MKSYSNFPADDIEILDCIQRQPSKIADDRDLRSIRESGIRIPLVCVEHDGRQYLADGLRRIRFAKHLELSGVPIVSEPLPAGWELEAWVRHLRFVLTQHAQNLAPSQKAAVVDKIKALPIKDGKKVTNKDVAIFLGVDTDSITNWMAIRKYVPEIVREIDAGRLTMQRARVFDGLTEEAQREIWKEHADELQNQPGRQVHQVIRKKYSPKSHPEYYRNAEKAAKRLKRKGEKRKGPAPRVKVTPNEHRRLLTSVEMKELELRDGNAEIAEAQREINAAIIPIRAVMRNDDLRAMVPPEILEGFGVFVERYG